MIKLNLISQGNRYETSTARRKPSPRRGEGRVRGHGAINFELGNPLILSFSPAGEKGRQPPTPRATIPQGEKEAPHPTRAVTSISTFISRSSSDDTT